MSQLPLMIISASVGLGHTIAAAALERTARNLYPDLHVQNINAFDYCTRVYAKAYSEFYRITSNHHPHLWGYFFDSTNVTGDKSRINRLLKVIGRARARNLMRYIERNQPQRIVCTHFMPVDVLGYLKRRGIINSLISLVVTDYYAHAMWLAEGAELYFVATEEVRWSMYRRGIPLPKLVVTGIPIAPQFTMPIDRQATCEKLDIRPDIFTVLLASWGGPLSDPASVIRAIARVGDRVQVLAVTGKNAALKRKLDELTRPSNIDLRVFGFVTNMHELMAVSDVVVTKCGGVTVAECLTMNLPMMIIAPIPGQEVHNCDYLLENRVAVKVASIYSFEHKFELLYRTPVLLGVMREAATTLARPHAAAAIIRELMDREI